MSKGNPDISLDIYHAIVPILHAEKTPILACADIMRIPLEQVVDGCVYQFELVHSCGECGGHGEIDTSGFGDIVNCDGCSYGKTTKRISHYDLADVDIALAYTYLISTNGGELHLTNNAFDAFLNKGTLRAIKIREAV